jgi:cytochrome bd-type quinol oxidase subunit 2
MYGTINIPPEQAKTVFALMIGAYIVIVVAVLAHTFLYTPFWQNQKENENKKGKTRQRKRRR